MKIRTGDMVKITAGKDKGKQGKVLQVLPADEQVVVEGLNIMTKNIKAQRRGEHGQQIQFPAPIHQSNVMVIDPKTSKPTRVGFRTTVVEEDGKKKTSKVRWSVKGNQAID